MRKTVSDRKNTIKKIKEQLYVAVIKTTKRKLFAIVNIVNRLLQIIRYM